MKVKGFGKRYRSFIQAVGEPPVDLTPVAKTINK